MRSKVKLHPVLVRITHWINVAALYIMVASGLRIYNASPFFDWAFPDWMTLGGWLAGGRQWHFFGMWLFAFNGVTWLTYSILRKRSRTTTFFTPQDRTGVLPMVRYYLKRQKEPPEYYKYNALQKLGYTTLPVIALIAIASGLSIYWPVQLSWLTSIFGGYDAARVWHFCAMAFLTLFVIAHVILVASAGWATFFSMITGKGYVGMREPDAVKSEEVPAVF